MTSLVNEINHDWLRYSLRKRSGTLHADQVYLRMKQQKNKSYKNVLYIGHDICKLMQLSEGDRADIFFDYKNPYFMKIIKSEIGLQLCQGKGSEVLSLHFVSTKEVFNVDIISTMSVRFDIFNDRSMLVDCSKFKGQK